MSQPLALSTSDSKPEESYWSLLKATQCGTSPGLVNHLASQTQGIGAEDGRVAVIEFRDHSQPTVKVLTSSKQLSRYLNRTASTAESPWRRIFVLEGLPRNYIEVLGSRLKIPPAFFSSHWLTRQVVGGLLNRPTRHHDRRSRCVLKMYIFHNVEIQAEETDAKEPIYRMDTSIGRKLSRLTPFGDFGGPLMSVENISFWSKTQNDSWNAVILVEPPLGDRVHWRTRGSKTLRVVNRVPSSKLGDALAVQEAAQQEGSWYPPVTKDNTVSGSRLEGTEIDVFPEMHSRFDEIVRIYHSVAREATADPVACLDAGRKLALSAWTAYIRYIESLVVDEQFRISTGPETADSDTVTWLDNAWLRPWEPRIFGRVVRARMALEEIAVDLRANMDALGVIDAANDLVVQGWEAEAWQTLHESLESSKRRLDVLWQAYSQAVSVRESIFSNKQGRQVGYLTSLATVFIPVSFVAAIFSMGGDFAAGQDHFWVYWAISLPVAAIGCLLLFTPLGAWILKVLGRESTDDSMV